jgi:hypothetical protein
MILPGTYIEVRDEGLIRPGPISTGNVGIVGTAAKGRLAADLIYTPSDAGQARQIFGEPGPAGAESELTLVRAIELAAANGAQRIFAARVAAAGADRTTYELAGGVEFEALAPGAAYDGGSVGTGPLQVFVDVRVAPEAGGNRVESIGPVDRTDPDAFVAAVSAASTRFRAETSNNPSGPVEIGEATRTEGAAAVARVLTLPAGGGAVRLTAVEAGAGTANLTVTVADGANADECAVTIDPGGGGPVESLTGVPRPADGFIERVTDESELVTASDNGAGSDPVQNGAATEETAGADATPAVFELPAGAGQVRIIARTPGTAANGWVVSAFGMVDVTITAAGTSETWRGVSTDPARFAAILNGTDTGYQYRRDASTGGGSALFTVTAGAGDTVGENEVSSQTATGGNGAGATPDDYAAGLDALLLQDVQIVVLAGSGGPDHTAALIEHVRNASSDVLKHERIAIIGSDPSRTRQQLVAPAQDDGRLVFAGPGLRTSEGGLPTTLPGTYTAAAVAGLISSLDPHVSPTNKTITAGGLETAFSGTDLEQLVLGRVLVLEDRQGAIRVVRGITTSTNTAWQQITTRRIVDYARRGTRAAADPFIGKLNNERVRSALKSSINSLLADMVDREMLTAYTLDVSATRDEEIRGIASVVMVVQPTFSIDFIRVVMYLQ